MKSNRFTTTVLIVFFIRAAQSSTVNCKTPADCKNGGTCPAGSTAPCACKGGYSGDTCDTAECSTGVKACQNGGTCNRKTCACPPAYTGGFCEKAECSTGVKACQNGGTCKTKTCACPPAYTGGFCEKDVDECAASSSPCHKDANCTNTVGSFTCACKSGFTGDGQTCTGGARAYEADKLMTILVMAILLMSFM